MRCNSRLLTVLLTLALPVVVSAQDERPTLSKTMSGACKDDSSKITKYIKLGSTDLSKDLDKPVQRVWEVAEIKKDLIESTTNGGAVEAGISHDCLASLYSATLLDANASANIMMAVKCPSGAAEVEGTDEHPTCAEAKQNKTYVRSLSDEYEAKLNNLAKEVDKATEATDECTDCKTEGKHTAALACCPIFKTRNPNLTTEQCIALNEGGKGAPDESCLKNVVGGLINGFKSQLSIITDVFSASFYSGMWTLLKELVSNPAKAVASMVEGLLKSLDFDPDYFQCLHKDNRGPFYCKLAGNVISQASMLAGGWSGIFKILRYGKAAAEGSALGKSLSAALKAEKFPLSDLKLGTKIKDGVNALKKVPGNVIRRLVATLKKSSPARWLESASAEAKRLAGPIARKLNEMKVNRSLPQLEKRLKALKKRPPTPELDRLIGKLEDEIKIKSDVKSALSEEAALSLELDTERATLREINKRGRKEFSSMSQSELNELAVEAGAQKLRVAELETKLANMKAANNPNLEFAAGKGRIPSDPTLASKSVSELRRELQSARAERNSHYLEVKERVKGGGGEATVDDYRGVSERNQRVEQIEAELRSRRPDGPTRDAALKARQQKAKRGRLAENASEKKLVEDQAEQAAKAQSAQAAQEARAARQAAREAEKNATVELNRLKRQRKVYRDTIRDLKRIGGETEIPVQQLSELEEDLAQAERKLADIKKARGGQVDKYRDAINQWREELAQKNQVRADALRAWASQKGPEMAKKIEAAIQDLKNAARNTGKKVVQPIINNPRKAGVAVEGITEVGEPTPTPPNEAP